MNKKIKLGWKFYISVIVIPIFIGIFLFVINKVEESRIQNQIEKAHEKITTEDAQNKRESDTKKEKQNVSGNKEVSTIDHKAMTMEELEALIEIPDRKKFIEPTMGLYSIRMNEGMTLYIQENNIKASKAEYVDSAVSETDPWITEFYMRLNDAEATLVTAAYDTKEYEVSVRPCQYTNDELANGIMTDNGPENRGAE